MLALPRNGHYKIFDIFRFGDPKLDFSALYYNMGWGDNPRHMLLFCGLDHMLTCILFLFVSLIWNLSWCICLNFIYFHRFYVSRFVCKGALVQTHASTSQPPNHPVRLTLPLSVGPDPWTEYHSGILEGCSFLLIFTSQTGCQCVKQFWERKLLKIVWGVLLLVTRG